MTLVRVNTKKYAPKIPQSTIVNAEFILAPTKLYKVLYQTDKKIKLIYLLSHEDIIKIFKIKHLKWEIVSYLLLSVIFYIFFTLYIKNMTEEFNNDAVFESNISINQDKEES